jgi:hypothetical protein
MNVTNISRVLSWKTFSSLLSITNLFLRWILLLSWMRRHLFQSLPILRQLRSPAASVTIPSLRDIVRSPIFLQSVNWKIPRGPQQLFSTSVTATFSIGHSLPQPSSPSLHRPDPRRCVSLPSSIVTLEELYQTHSVEYISRLQSRDDLLCSQQDLYLNESSFDAALRAAGSAISVSRQIVSGESYFGFLFPPFLLTFCSGKARSGFAMTRPPGHHARRASTGGFCLLNNIAIAVNDIFSQQQRQQQEQKQVQVQEQLVSASSGGQQIDRILIFDWDIHHGTLPTAPSSAFLT